jgi:hypothetical protein
MLTFAINKSYLTLNNLWLAACPVFGPSLI